MTLSFNAAADFSRLVDGLEPVTLVRRGGAVTSSLRGLRTASSISEATPNAGHCTAARATWDLPQAECPTAPSPGDALIDAAGHRWTVLTIHTAVHTARWKCTCLNLAIQHGLDDTVSVEESERIAQPGGGVSLTWRTWRTGVRARIQPLGVAVDDELEPPQSVRTYRIYLAEELPLDHRHRIRAADGALYRITAYSAAAALDSLPYVDTEGIA